MTVAFNYRANPELMAELLWRFDHLSPRARGHDASIQLANLSLEVGARVRKKLADKVVSISLIAGVSCFHSGLSDTDRIRGRTRGVINSLSHRGRYLVIG